MKLGKCVRIAGMWSFAFLAAGEIFAQTIATRNARQTYAEFVAKMNAMHRAPYERGAVLGRVAKKTGVQAQVGSRALLSIIPRKTAKVNEDRNPYTKTVGGIAIDVSDAKHVVVVSDDDRLGPPNDESSLGYTDDFLHISKSAGRRWSDQEGRLGAHTLAQTSVGVSMNRTGDTFVATDSHDDFQINTDSSVQVQRVAHDGTTLPNLVADSRQCVNFDGGDQCIEVLQAQGIHTDNSGSANDGMTYVYYTVFCNDGSVCEEGDVPGAGSVTKVAISPGFMQPFGAPAIWSGSHFNTGAASMVVDASGTPHLFFLDYTSKPTIALWESTNGVVDAKPVVTFVDAGLGNPNWTFNENKVLDCGGNGSMAYCGFAATQVVGRPVHSTPSIYIAAINLVNGKTSINRVNDDALDRGKDHFNPAVAVTHEGEVFVGWFDDRDDPVNLRVDYFVGKSTDGGKTFYRQGKINDVTFDPTIGGVGPSGALAVDGFSGVKAVWSDTRDGASQQVYTSDVFGLEVVRKF